jgi:hypothetical protein
MNTDEEIIKSLKKLGEFVREGLITQRNRDFSRHANVLMAIHNTVKERHVEDLEQMLRDKIKEIPDPKNPKAILEKHLLIQDINQSLASAKGAFAKPAPIVRASPENVKNPIPAKRDLKVESTKRTRPSRLIPKGAHKKKA